MRNENTMHADLKGALGQINKSYKSFEHKGKRMTKAQVKKVLNYGLSKGYKTTAELSDEEVDLIINHPVQDVEKDNGQSTLFNLENFVVNKYATCRTCEHRQRHEYYTKVFHYCGIRKSNRTGNGLLKIKCKDIACPMYLKIATQPTTSKK
jgi:hypothetical protein